MGRYKWLNAEFTPLKPYVEWCMPHQAISKWQTDEFLNYSYEKCNGEIVMRIQKMNIFLICGVFGRGECICALRLVSFWSLKMLAVALHPFSFSFSYRQPDLPYWALHCGILVENNRGTLTKTARQREDIREIPTICIRTKFKDIITVYCWIVANHLKNDPKNILSSCWWNLWVNS